MRRLLATTAALLALSTPSEAYLARGSHAPAPHFSPHFAPRPYLARSAFAPRQVLGGPRQFTYPVRPGTYGPRWIGGAGPGVANWGGFPVPALTSRGYDPRFGYVSPSYAPGPSYYGAPQYGPESYPTYGVDPYYDSYGPETYGPRYAPDPGVIFLTIINNIFSRGWRY